MTPWSGFHFFSVLNFVALLVVNTFVFDEMQLIWLVLLNCMVFIPVITAYIPSLVTATSNRVSRKRFFYACAVNNIGLIGVLIGVLVVMASNGWWYDVSRQPDVTQLATIYKADLKLRQAEDWAVTDEMTMEPAFVDEVMSISADG